MSYRTAWEWSKTGKLPGPAVQTATGTILVQEQTKNETNAAAVYVGVSSSDQKGDLDGQVARAVTALNKQGASVAKTVTEVGAGLDGLRPKLIALLKGPHVRTIAVEHRDRLMRFGSEYVEAALAAAGRKLLVVEPPR